MMMMRREKRTSVVLSARALQIRANVVSERRWREHPRGGAPAENPAAERQVVAHLEGQHDAAVTAITKCLRRVPHAGANVWRHPLVKGDFHMRRRSCVHAEGVAKHIVRDCTRRRERLLLE